VAIEYSATKVDPAATTVLPLRDTPIREAASS
jgi:hypothetical protein